MKYICLGYMDETKWETMSEAEQKEFMDTCFEYDHEMHKNGHLKGGEGLQSSRNAATIRYISGKVSVTDGPFIETKEQIGGLMILEARDMNHAIHLMSNHPSVRMGGGWEIRPAEDISELIAESERRIAESKLKETTG
jgi:hypothetical protein